MPEIKVTLDPEVHKKLKEYAKEDDRSLKKYIERGLKYLANNPYHNKPGIVYSPVFPTPTTPEQLYPPYPYTVTATQTLTPTSTPTLEQLQEQGITQIKFKSQNQKTLTPEEEKLQQLKTQQQIDKIKEQRTRFLKQKADEILGFLPDYLVDNDQEVIDFVLNAYPTNDEILTYLNKVKNGELPENILHHGFYLDDIEKREEHLLLPADQNETYQKIKTYALKNGLTEQLYRLLEYPHFDLDAITQEVEDELLRPALGSPLDYKYDKLELNELTKCLSWEEFELE